MTAGAQLPDTPDNSKGLQARGLIGQGTVPAVSYPELARPGLPLPQRPAPVRANSSSSVLQRPEVGGRSSSTASFKPLSPNPAPVVLPKTSRTPSPDKRSKMKTTLRVGKDSKRAKPRDSAGTRQLGPSSKAAGLAWDSNSSHTLTRTSGQYLGQSLAGATTSMSSLIPSSGRDIFADGGDPRRSSQDSVRKVSTTTPTSPPYFSGSGPRLTRHSETTPTFPKGCSANSSPLLGSNLGDPPPYLSESINALPLRTAAGQPKTGPSNLPIRPSDFPSYRNEYLTPTPVSQASIAAAVNPPRIAAGTGSSTNPTRRPSPPPKPRVPPPPPIHRRPVTGPSLPTLNQHKKLNEPPHRGSSDDAESNTTGRDVDGKSRLLSKKKLPSKITHEDSAEDSSGRDSPEGSLESQHWEERLAYIKKNLPKGVDPWAAKQVFTEIVVKGDEVHWSDVAGLEQAKTALKEAVVYPFLRPDLFMGLREPARGMLLFGPPGTGKTMLARAVATESRSTFFAISASSLTSKWLGESEKLVRALFLLAKALAPSIIFVDEIDSLLSSRGGSSEHESSRRIKTEFLIQWSDLQRAAAGKEQSDKEKKEGDASRVLVLAATNLPWAIDEAARRRFVRRQYIPLPEPPVREEQLRTLLSHQKHSLSKNDIQVLVKVTDGKDSLGIGRLPR